MDPELELQPESEPLFIEPEDEGEANDDLPEGVANFTWELPKKRPRHDEESYSPSTSSGEKVRVVKATSRKARKPGVLVEGCHTKSLKKIKPTTMYCYLNNFHNFWKWLFEFHIETVAIAPPQKCPQTIDEMQYFGECPVRINLITPEIFFEYVGTNDISKYQPVVCMIRQSLKKIADLFGLEKIYNRFVLDVKSKEITTAVTKKFDRKRFVKAAPAMTVKRRIVDDDIDDSPTQNYSNYESLLYLKYMAYKQWEFLEILTPGVVYVPIDQ